MTTATETTSVQDPLAGIKIIDADTHFTEPPDLWTRHAPASYRDRMPQMRTVDGKSRWFVDGDIEFSGVGESVVRTSGDKDKGRFTLDTFDEMDKAASDVKARMKVMDDVGIHAQIVFSGAAGHGVSKFMNLEDKDLRLQCIKGYNDAMAEMQAESGGRFLPQALLPYWDGEMLTKEAIRCAEELNMTGFDILDKPEKLGLPNYDDDYYRPFWEFCDATRTALDLHIGAVATNPLQVPWDTFGFEKSMTVWSILAYISNAGAIANFCLSGIFDRYPNLRVVSTESGVGWIPYMLEAMEYQFDEMMPHEAMSLQKRPSEYFRDNMYACFWFESKSLGHALEVLGDRNTLFETDFPHPTCYYPNSRERVAKTLASIPEQSRRRVLQDNAAELYKIPV